jgi:hypothetical protein
MRNWIEQQWKRLNAGDLIRHLADAKIFLQPFNLSLKARDDSSKIANVADNEKKREETARQV